MKTIIEKKLNSMTGYTTTIVYDTPNNCYNYTTGEITNNLIDVIIAADSVEMIEPKEESYVLSVMLENWVAENAPAVGVQDDDFADCVKDVFFSGDSKNVEAARKEARETYNKIVADIVAATLEGNDEKIKSILEGIKHKVSELDEEAKKNNKAIEFLQSLLRNLNSNYTAGIGEAIERLITCNQVIAEKSVPYCDFLHAFYAIEINVKN